MKTSRQQGNAPEMTSTMTTSRHQRQQQQQQQPVHQQSRWRGKPPMDVITFRTAADRRQPDPPTPVTIAVTCLRAGPECRLPIYG